ncbi:MAG: ATP-binding protein, partial [Gemmatimonadaceae bacterium]
MREPRTADSATDFAGRKRLLRAILVAGAVSLLLLGIATAWRGQVTLLAALEETAVDVRAADAAALVERQAALATRLATLMQSHADINSEPGRALRIERLSGPDAIEFVASDANTRLAVGGVLALNARSSKDSKAIDALLAALPAQRLALESESAVSAEVEGLYIALPEANALARVPYVAGEQLRVRLRDASLATWFQQEVFNSGLDMRASVSSAQVGPDPVTGEPVVRLERPVWLHRRSYPATVIATVKVDSYLARLAHARAPITTLTALVDARGRLVAAATRRDGEPLMPVREVPPALQDVVSTLGPEFERIGDWFALSVPVTDSRFSAIIAVPVTEVRAETLRRTAPHLILVLGCGLALALLASVIRRRIVDPAERAVAHVTAAEALVREITDGLPGLAVFKATRDEDARVTVSFVSRGTANVLGVPAVAIADDWQLAFESVVPDDAAAVRAGYERAFADAVGWQQEFRVRRRDEERWIRVEARATRVGACVELLGSWRDVTEGREHTELLADAHKRLVELADGVPGAVIQWRVTDDGRQEVAFVGNRLPEIAGIGTSDLYSGLHAFEQVQLAEDVDAVRRARQQAVATQQNYAVEYRVMHPGRGMRWLREEAVSHQVAGCIAAFTVHISDVTQQRKEAGELRRAKEEAETATRAKSVFLATMSHEIRTPMTGISGMIEVLGRTVLDADQRQQLATISDSARTLRRILDDVLDFSRIEAGKMTVERRPISIDDVIESTAGLYAAAAVEKGVKLRASVDPRIGELLMGDAVRLRQVLGNLLSNAVKFTSRGSVRLSVTQESMNDTHRELRFEVTDTGPGIPYEIQPRLFAPFERGEHAITTLVGGTGLGLALVRRIVDLMDGSVDLRSLPGVGTAVAVRIPFERLHEETTDMRVSLAGLKVAVVHDVDIDARFLSALLEGRGAAVITVNPDQVNAVSEGTACDVIVVGADVAREVQHAVRARLSAGVSGHTQLVRLFDGAGIRPEVRGDGGVTLAPHARRSASLRAVAIAAGRDEPDLPSTTAENRTPATPEASSVAEAVAERRLILVCEDHPIAQRVIEKQLRVLGYTAELHGNGQSGFNAWQSGRYGLVLTDLHMPEVDGLTLARRIRAEEQRNPTLSRTPIIALSGNAFDEQRVVCVEAGMDDFLAKPALLKELDATLRFWLPPSSRPSGDEAKPSASSALPVTLPAPLSHKALKESLGDDPEVLRAALGEFLAADIDDMSALQIAYESDDRNVVVSHAHRIEGAARMLGAMPYAR